MHQFVRNLITEWRRLDLPVGESAIVVGVSGGADSVSLLLALNELRKRGKLSHRIIAAHFNHSLRDGASDSDEEFVRGLTADLKIELSTAKAKIEESGNLEQIARDLRYEFLLNTAKNVKAFAVLTGHTMNDQAETVLMNLIRGSGPDGLAGIRPVRIVAHETAGPAEQMPLLPPPEIKLVRPLLTWALRGQTEAYCRDLGIEYCYDTMNEDTAFRRVRIRKVLIPLLEDFNPRIIETLSNTAKLMQSVAGDAAVRLQDAGPDVLTLAELRSTSKGEMYDTIRDWLRRQRGSTRRLQLKHMESIERLVFSTKSGRTAELPGGRVVKRNGSLIYQENKVEN